MNTGRHETITFACPLQLPRYVSPRVAAETARMLEASGVVDEILIYDYLVSFVPRSMWTPDNTPLAGVSRDDDSYHDAFVLAAIAAASCNLGICIMTDAMRRGPWISQTMFSLADATEGQVTLALGAGEARHARPFGYERKEGLGRLKELLKIWKRMLDCEEPFDFDGKYWKLQRTYLGTVRPKRRPKIWALGGGPKLFEAAALDADGILTQIPSAWATPAQCAEVAAGIKAAVARNGRNPDEFGIGVSAGVVIHEDPKEIDRILHTPLVKWLSAMVGRFSMEEWVKEGHQPPFPVGWHYANDLFPASMNRAECEAASARMTTEMLYKANIVGTPAQVAARLQEYVDAGANWIVPFDLTGLANQDSLGCMKRVLEVGRILKGGARS